MRTTDYGDWVSVGDYSLTVEDTVLDNLRFAETDWINRVKSSGAFHRMVYSYREAINTALPAGVSLVGDQFIGPADVVNVDLAEAVGSVDLQGIIDRHDPDKP